MIHGIDVAVSITIDSDCDMSCEVVDDQVLFIFGRRETGLLLYLDWPTLHKFLRVVGAAVQHAQSTPAGQPSDFMVSADASSRREHTPNYQHDTGNELLAVDVDNPDGRQLTL